MTNKLPLPAELMHLIEKRVGEDRRGSEQSGDTQRGEDQAETASAPTTSTESDVDSATSEERRKAARRTSD